jgi:hypothetical protein
MDVPHADLPAPIREVAERLRKIYRGRVADATVDKIVRDCYQPLADARIGGYVPILVENGSRQHLRDLAGPPTLPLPGSRSQFHQRPGV